MPEGVTVAPPIDKGTLTADGQGLIPKPETLRRPPIDKDKVHGDGARMDAHALDNAPAFGGQLEAKLKAGETPPKIITDLGADNSARLNAEAQAQGFADAAQRDAAVAGVAAGDRAQDKMNARGPQDAADAEARNQGFVDAAQRDAIVAGVAAGDKAQDEMNARGASSADTSNPPWQRAQQQTENASSEGSGLKDTKARADAMNTKTPDELADLAADGNILAKRALADSDKDATQITDGTATTPDVQGEDTTDQPDTDRFMTDDEWTKYRDQIGGDKTTGPVRRAFSRMGQRLKLSRNGKDASTGTPDGSASNRPKISAEQTAALNRSGILTDEQRKAKRAEIDAQRAAKKAPEQTDTNVAQPQVDADTSTTSAETSSPANEQPKMTDAELSAEVARRRYEQIHGEPMPDATTETTSSKGPDVAKPVVDTQPSTPEADTGPKAPENTADTEPEAKAELSPEAAERKKIMEMGSELAKLGIDTSSPEGRRIFDLLAENPDHMDAVKATAEFAKLGGAEVAAAATNAAADKLDEQISIAQESGDKATADRLGILKTILLALGKALLVGGAFLVKTAAVGTVQEASAIAQAVAKNTTS